MLETQFLLAEVELEAGRRQGGRRAGRSAGRVSCTPRSHSRSTTRSLRMFVAAVRANLALGRAGQGGGAANLLVELGPDEPAVDGVLNSILKMFGDCAGNEAEAAAIEARTDRRPAAPRRRRSRRPTDRKERVGSIAGEARPRKHITLAGHDLHRRHQRRSSARRIRARPALSGHPAQADADPAFKQANASA